MSCFYFILFFKENRQTDTVSFGPGQFWAHCVVEGDLEPLIFPPLPQVLRLLVGNTMLSVVLQIKPKALHMLGKAAANRALSLGPQMHCFKNSSRSVVLNRMWFLCPDAQGSFGSIWRLWKLTTGFHIPQRTHCCPQTRNYRAQNVNTTVGWKPSLRL